MKKYPFDYDEPHDKERWKETVFVVLFALAGIAVLAMFVIGIAILTGIWR